MAEPQKRSETHPQNADEAKDAAAQYRRDSPTEPNERALDSERSGASLSEDIRARTLRPHKGDVGRPETNEEVYQGSKEKEIK